MPSENIVNAEIKNLAISSSQNAIKLSWDNNEDITSYNVYCAVGDAAEYTLIGNTRNTFFDDTEFNADGSQYRRYKVKSVFASGKESKGVYVGLILCIPMRL